MEKEILQKLKHASKLLSSSEIADALGKKQRIVQTALKKLLDEGSILAHGKGRARKYEIAKYNTIALGWNEDFLLDYIPNQSFYLSEQTRVTLNKLGAPTLTLPAGTYARRIVERLLIDLSWNSSRLEGNTYSLLDTEKLLLTGEAEGRDALETQMILNHKDAIEYLIESADELDFSPFTIRSLHGILSANLLADPQLSGALRDAPVGISGSSYIPLAHPQRIESAFKKICELASEIDDPFESSLFLLIHVPYLQPFIDVNKRVSRLAANISFIKKSYYPLSFVDTDREEYLQSILQVYESQNISKIRDLFIRTYQRSAQKYMVIASSIGDPDPFRLKYRKQLKIAIAVFIRQHISESISEPEFFKFMSLTELEVGEITEEDREHFIFVVKEEVHALHIGNIARYRIRPMEFEAYKKASGRAIN